MPGWTNTAAFIFDIGHLAFGEAALHSPCLSTAAVAGRGGAKPTLGDATEYDMLSNQIDIAGYAVVDRPLFAPDEAIKAATFALDRPVDRPQSGETELEDSPTLVLKTLRLGGLAKFTVAPLRHSVEEQRSSHRQILCSVAGVLAVKLKPNAFSALR